MRKLPAHLTRRKALHGLAAGTGALALSSSTAALGKATGLMRTEQSLAWTPAWQLREMMADKSLSPVELTRYFLDRIDRIDPLIHAYITVDREGALAQAALAEKAISNGDTLGPLHGIPISIKDLYATKGLVTTQGSMAMKDLVPTVDEILVERLRNAGAIIVGKTNAPEFATFPRTKTLLAGETLNPWDRKRISGASSGGAAASVAAGITPFAIGSDGGGSTRIPAALNGVFGFQPSAGRIPSRSPVSVHMSSAGPITQDVRDGAIIMQVLAGRDARDPSAIDEPSPDLVSALGAGVAGKRIGWSRDWGVVTGGDPRAIDVAEKAVRLFSTAGANVEVADVTLPDSAAWPVFIGMNEYSYRRTGRLLGFSAEKQALFTPPVKAMLAQIKAMGGELFSADDYMRLFETRAELVRWIDTVFERHDFICTPTVGMIAPLIPDGEWDQPYTDKYSIDHISTNYTYIANVLGLPAASVPCGFVDGMPVGLQIIGPRLADAEVFAAAHAFSRIQPWAGQHPSIATI